MHQGGGGGGGGGGGSSVVGGGGALVSPLSRLDMGEQGDVKTPALHTRGGPGLAGSLNLAPLDMTRLGSSASSVRVPPGGWNTERVTHRAMDPISLKRNRLRAGTEIEVFDKDSRGPSPLPTLKEQLLRKRSIGLRTDGHAAMIPSLQVHANKGLSGLKLSMMQGKLQNVMSVIQNKAKAKDQFFDIVDQVIIQAKKGPSVGARVVVRLRMPFMGYRAEGTVKYVGACPEEGPGIWLGLELEKGVGMHDGMGYFRCRSSPGSDGPFYATFVKSTQIEFSTQMSDGLKQEGVRLLPPMDKNLRSIKFWRDPFKATPYPPFLGRVHPIIPGLSVTVGETPQLLHPSGAQTAR